MTKTKNKRLALLCISALFLFLFCCTRPSYSKDVKSKEDEMEEKIGKEASAEIENEEGIVNDKEKTQKLTRMVQRLVSFATKTPPSFQFQCKILNSNDVNAFSLPGGYIYVTKGLLDFVQSDHELAAVLAHEIGHSTLHHAIKKMQKDKKVFLKTNLGAILAAILTKEPSSIGPLYIAANAIRSDVISGFGRKAELEADAQSVHTLYAAGYNPVGALTMLERLLRMQNRHPEVEMGIFQTHPDPELRVKEAYSLLKQLGVTVNRRLVTQSIKIDIKLDENASDSPALLLFNSAEIVKLYGYEEEKTPYERAKKYQETLSQAILDGLEGGQLRTVINAGAGSAFIMAGKHELLKLTEGDARGAGKKLDALADEALQNLRNQLWKDFLNTSTF